MNRQEHERLLATEQRKTAWERDQAQQAEEARYAAEKKLLFLRRALVRLYDVYTSDESSYAKAEARVLALKALDETKEYQ